MDRQQEYDLRKTIADTINNDTQKELERIYEKIKDNFTAKYIFPLAVLEKRFLDFIKQVFLDFLNMKLESGFIPYIKTKLVSMLSSPLIKYLKNNDREFTIKRVDKLLFDSDDMDNLELKDTKYIFFFKTSILSLDDIKIPKKILNDNKSCTLVILTIFIAPKCADLILSKEINSTVITTIYFSDFFIKYENIIKNNETIFNDKDFKQLIVEKFKMDFNYDKQLPN